jgi:hypothetical protein
LNFNYYHWNIKSQISPLPGGRGVWGPWFAGVDVARWAGLSATQQVLLASLQGASSFVFQGGVIRPMD